MTKPFIKQKPFGRPRSATGRARASSDLVAAATAETLPLASLDDAACFETLRIYARRAFRLEEHVERLFESCASIARPLAETPAVVRRWIADVAEEAAFSEALVRVSVHRGGPGSGRLVAIVRAFAGHPAEWYRHGVSMETTAARRPAPRAQEAQVKASAFVPGVLATIDLAGRGAHEILFLGHAGTVAEGATSNLFAVRSKCLLTPCAASGILRGVTRGVAMELALARGLHVSETFLTRHDLYSADECFLTNTSSEVLPVTRVDGRPIGSGEPGPVTQTLAHDFKKRISEWLKSKPR